MSIDWLQMLRGLLLKVMPLCYSSKRLILYLFTSLEGQMRLYIQQTAKLVGNQLGWLHRHHGATSEGS
jgi:hypothetical protein